VQDIDAFVAPAVTNQVPVVADMSSDFLSHPFNAQNFTLIYAGAQKNLGPAGTTVVIVRKDALGKTGRKIPTMMNYQTHIDNGSMFNTPPVFAVYVSMLTLRWIQEMGGLTAMAIRNEAKANLLYAEIDRNSLFTGTTVPEDRSRMNVTFLLHDNQLEDAFLKRCKENGLMGLQGHRSVGGFRASIYNALDISSVQVLVDIMKDFEQQFA
jgi:phosphoserine aminotransferase